MKVFLDYYYPIKNKFSVKKIQCEKKLNVQKKKIRCENIQHETDCLNIWVTREKQSHATSIIHRPDNQIILIWKKKITNSIQSSGVDVTWAIEHNLIGWTMEGRSGHPDVEMFFSHWIFYTLNLLYVCKETSVKNKNAC